MRNANSVCVGGGGGGQKDLEWGKMTKKTGCEQIFSYMLIDEL